MVGNATEEFACASCSTHAVVTRALDGLLAEEVDSERVRHRHDAERDEEGGEGTEHQEVAVEDAALAVAEEFIGSRDTESDNGACNHE